MKYSDIANGYINTIYDPFKDMDQTGSINLPNWIRTATKSAKSDEEILKEVEELAQEHAKTGIFQKSNRFEELKTEYISSVSPDRKSILKNKINEIYERMSSVIHNERIPKKIIEKDKEDNQELMDYFMEVLGIESGDMYSITAIRCSENYTNVDIDYGEGKITTLVYEFSELMGMTIKSPDLHAEITTNGVVTYATFYCNGEEIMCHNENGLGQLYTKAEKERSDELLDLYNEAFNFAN